MKNLREKLQSVAKSLVSLSKQVEMISAQINKLQSSKMVSVKTAKRRAPKATASKKVKRASQKTVLDSVYEVIRRSKRGATVVALKEKTGFGPRQISNALYKLSKKGVVVAKARGLYVKK